MTALTKEHVFDALGYDWLTTQEIADRLDVDCERLFSLLMALMVKDKLVDLETGPSSPNRWKRSEIAWEGGCRR